MHPFFFSLALRLSLVIVTCCALGAAACWSITDTLGQTDALQPQITDIEPASLPGTDTGARLLEAANWTMVRPSEPAVKQVDQSLLSPRGAEREQAMLGLILRDGRTAMAMIDGRIVRPGETLPDGRVVQDITAHGVVLLAADKAELVVWAPPSEVRLDKPAETSPQDRQEGRGSKAAPDAESDRPDMKPGQAIQLLRQFAGTHTAN